VVNVSHVPKDEKPYHDRIGAKDSGREEGAEEDTKKTNDQRSKTQRQMTKKKTNCKKNRNRLLTHQSAL
jgi:hypothetical protein